jgi:uncharacterized membrane protein HdeD (DUF308 family)
VAVTVAVVDVEVLARNWWVLLLRGLAGILFGVVTFIAPGISLAAVVLVFGAYAFVDGALAIVSAIRRRRSADRWWLLLLQGAVGIFVGVATLLWPGITALALLYLIAFWALVTGGLELAAAIRLRKVITHEWLLALAGIASIGLGALLLLFPGPGALALILWIGAYALVSGVLLVVLSFKLRAWSREMHPSPSHVSMGPGSPAPGTARFK